MSFSKIKAVSLTDLFIQQIENMILSGELSVGEQLPSSRDLCIKMGISRPVVSAGLIELEKLGFVEVVPRQGVFVSDYRRKGSMETLAAIIRFNNGAMRQNEVKSLLEVRDACESLCLKLVMENKSSAEIETLSPLLERIGASKTNDECAEYVFKFYHELAVMSGNAILPLFYYSFHEQGIYLWSLYCKKHSIDMMYKLKLDLFSALLNKDIESVLKQTHIVLQNAIDDLAFYGA